MRHRHHSRGRRAFAPLLLAGATLAGLLPALSAAQAQEGPGGPPRMERGEGDRGWHGRGGPGRHHGMPGPRLSPAKLATALAALETGIGIRPDQTEPWRAFTASVIAFSEASEPPRFGRPDRGPRRDGPPPPAAAAPDAADDADAAEEADDGPDSTRSDMAFAMVDRFADRAIERGQRAQEMKTALANLRTALTPEQIETAQVLVRSMIREAREERREERGDRGERKGPPHGRGDHERGDKGRGGPDGDDRRDRD